MINELLKELLIYLIKINNYTLLLLLLFYICINNCNGN